MLDNFVKINRDGSVNGFESFNLGFILHGKPGTGKTSIIKAMCNYLKRSAIIIDLKKVKSIATFRKIFIENRAADFIFVLEEFDCVRDIIKRRGIDKNGNNGDDGNIENIGDLDSTSSKEQLKIRRENLINMSCVNKDCNMEQINAQIEKIDEALVENEDLLDLQSILMILDGLEEARNRIIVANTNHLEFIDPALLREGRFDMKLEFAEYNRDEIREILFCIYKSRDGLMIDNLATDKNQIMKKMIDGVTFESGKHTPARIINMYQRGLLLDEMIEHLRLK